ncbi:SulP family inorganic anion transporter [Nocardioides sp. NPDC047086]|uniref:SulP family inorganic anion transporter n=1 Tax=Nocardioides sp. NPDC047086 TaxID=3154810 RepID=UPI0033C3E0F1
MKAWLFPTMRGYRRSWLRGDVLAGLATGTVVIPQAMAYATIAGMPAHVGLYTCLLPMAAYALLGGAHALSVSTTSTISVLVASSLAGLSERDPDELMRAAFTLTFLVGVFLLVMRLARLGALVESISPATLTGIRLGVGLTVVASQLPALLGLPADPDAEGFFAELVAVARDLPELSAVTAVVGVSAIVILLVLRRLAPGVPGPLVVAAGIVLVATGIGALAGGLTQSLPPAGGFSQSAVNLRSGARTQLSGLVTVGLALLVALALAPLLADLPQTILAAMVLVAVAGLLDPRELATYAAVDRTELWVALAVAAVGLTGGMLLGVAVGVCLTLLLVIRAVNQPRVRRLESPSAHDEVLPLVLTGDLYTGNAQATYDAALGLMQASTARTVTLDTSALTRVTVPLLNTLRSLREDLAAEGTELVLLDVPDDVLAILRRAPWFVEAEQGGFVG